MIFNSYTFKDMTTKKQLLEQIGGMYNKKGLKQILAYKAAGALLGQVGASATVNAPLRRPLRFLNTLSILNP